MDKLGSDALVWVVFESIKLRIWYYNRQINYICTVKYVLYKLWFCTFDSMSELHIHGHFEIYTARFDL